MSIPNTAQDFIEAYQLEALPEEGGYYRRIYTHALRISSAIHFLITPEAFSALHRIDSDELFAFQAGDACEMIQVTEEGRLNRLSIGWGEGLQPTASVPKQTWQGLKLRPGGAFAFFTVFVSPEFRWEGFELGERDALSRQFPDHTRAIETYTR